MFAANPSAAQNTACDVSVVVPTYREAENLPLLVPRIAAALTAAGLHGEILVIDDNSPDNTREVCERLAAEFPLRLIVRLADRGLSRAVIEGLNQARGGVVVVMDADLSHPPEKIPEMLDAIRRGEADFVIGSRYVPGGGTDAKWGLFRWLNSKVATLLARPLTTARDPMAGFFALQRSRFLAAVSLDPIGYKIGLELIVKCGCRNVREVPIFFGNRCHGQSKLSLREQVNYLRHLRRLYVYRLGAAAQPLQFVLVGATGMVVDLAAFSAFVRVMPVYLARALAIWIAMTWNFALNRRLTFSHARQRSIVRQYALFCMSCAVGALVNWSAFVGLHMSSAFFTAHPLLTAFLGIVLGTASNYFLSKHVAFK